MISVLAKDCKDMHSNQTSEPLTRNHFKHKLRACSVHSQIPLLFCDIMQVVLLKKIQRKYS